MTAKNDSDNAPDESPPNPNSGDSVSPKQRSQSVKKNCGANDNLVTSETRRELHWLEKLNFIGQLSLVVVGIVAVSIYGCQLRTMNHQFGEMQTQTTIQRETSINSERAWVGLDQAIKVDYLQVSPRLVVVSHYSVKNFGHGPAFKVIATGFFWDDSNTLKNLANTICSDSIEFATGTVPVGPNVPKPGPMGYTLFPSQPHEEYIGSANDPWEGGAEPNLNHFWFVGCIAYLDQFKQVHWTRFCMEPELGPNPIGKDVRLKFCSLYNDTDEPQAKRQP